MIEISNYFFSLLLFTSNNLCLSRLESPLILMQYMYVYMHGQLRLNEWINLSCMKDERKNWLVFPSSLFWVLLMVRDFGGHHVVGSMSFSSFLCFLPNSFFLSLSSSLSDFILVVTLHCVHRMEYFFYSFALTTMF